MAKDDKRTLTPGLRFPKFRDAPEWDEKLLTNVVKSVKTGKLDANAMVEDGEFRFYTCAKNYYRIDNYAFDGEALLIAGNGAYLGYIHHYIGKFNAYQRTYVLQGFDINVIFLKCCLDRNLPARIDTEKKDGNTPYIVLATITEMPLQVPRDTNEQQKIAECLTSLDELIAAQGRRVETLKAHKKGLMQQLFPREGETLPQLRFPEFRDKPAWKPTTLDELVDIQSGGTPSKANPAFWNGSIPWVSAKDMKKLFLEDAEDHISTAAVDDGSKLVPAGTLLMLTRGMTLLKDVPICVLRREMCFNQDVKALRPKVDVDTLFLAFLLLGNKQRLLKMVDIAGHGTGKLNTDELKALELVSPQPAEQQRIADCLSALDARIAAEADKLAALKTHKKGLMQQLFPSPEGV